MTKKDIVFALGKTIADDLAAAVLDGAKPSVSEADSLGNMAVLDEMRTKGADARLWYWPTKGMGRDATWVTRPLRQL
jgi:hypothetical protein